VVKRKGDDAVESDEISDDGATRVAACCGENPRAVDGADANRVDATKTVHIDAAVTLR
jgi:hypothetical protein